MSKKDLILVIGAGRSGTSAVTRTLSLCGCALPDRLLGDIWEPLEFLKLNSQFMSQHGTEVPDARMLLEGISATDPDVKEYVQKLRALLRACPPAPRLLIKDPHITELMPFWLDAAQQEGFAVKVVIPIRHPAQVAASLMKFPLFKNCRERISEELTVAYWTKRNLLAERHSRELPHIFVEYSNLLNDWRGELKRVGDALSLDLRPDEAAIDKFLTRDLQHQSRVDAMPEPFAYSWTTRVYEILSAAARDIPIDFRSLDEIYHAYLTCERTFRIASDDFRVVFEELAKMSLSSETWDNARTLLAGRDF